MPVAVLDVPVVQVPGAGSQPSARQGSRTDANQPSGQCAAAGADSLSRLHTLLLLVIFLLRAVIMPLRVVSCAAVMDGASIPPEST